MNKVVSSGLRYSYNYYHEKYILGYSHVYEDGQIDIESYQDRLQDCFEDLRNKFYLVGVSFDFTVDEISDMKRIIDSSYGIENDYAKSSGIPS